MATDKDQFIAGLVAAHRPRRPLPRPGWRALGWFAAALAANALVMAVVQPFRPGFVGQLVAHPRLLLETAAGLLAVAAGAYVTFLHVVPGERLSRRGRVGVCSLAALFSASVLGGLVTASPDFGTSGRRSECWVEVLAYGGVTLASLLVMARRGYLRFTSGSSVRMGLIAGLVPAALMQIACMYNPFHALTFHYAPILVICAGAMLMARRLGGVG